MTMVTTASNFEIELRANTRALSLRVRLKGVLWGSPVKKAHRLSGSMRAQFRRVVVRVTLTLLQVLGSGQPQQQRSEVRYSLVIRLRRLWFRIRGKYQREGPHGIQVVKPAEGPTFVKKKWTRSLSSVGWQLLRRSKCSQNVTVLQPVKEDGYVAQYLTGFGTDRVVRVLYGVGMVSTFIVLVQLAGARGLPLLVTFLTGLAIVGWLVFVNRYALLQPGLQRLWYDAMSVGGISLLPQVLRAVFRPYLPQVGIVASESVMGTFTLVLILLARFKAMRWFGILSAGMPAILVVWALIMQLWTSCFSALNVTFMQIFTGLLAVSSNCLLGYPHPSLNQFQSLYKP